MKKSLIIGIILIIFCLGLTIYQEIKKTSIHYTNIHDITNSGSKIEGAYVSLDATFVAGTITKNFYVMFGDGVQYIVYISDKEANKINNYLLDNPNDSYKIYGITKLIPSTIENDGKKFVKAWLDTNHNHHDEEVEEGHTHDITTDEFYHYFGYVYLDTTNNDNIINKIIIYVTGVVGIMFVAYSLNTKYHFI